MNQTSRLTNVIPAAKHAPAVASPQLDCVPGIGNPVLIERLRVGLDAACEWIGKVAMVRQSDLIDDEDDNGLPYKVWDGAVRGEYIASTRRWGFFCPYWHSAQAAKGLIEAHAISGNASHLKDAECVGEFLLRHRITDRNDQDYGLPLAYEDSPRTVNTSAILESITGLLALSDATGRKEYEETALDALRWVHRTAYAGKGLFNNSYDPKSREFCLVSRYKEQKAEWQMRPLIDDSAFLLGYRRCGDERMLGVFTETALRLLETEYPSGNWINYLPCSREADYIHPRHAFWWGLPLLDAWKQTKDSKFRAAFLRSADWYAKALRRDGGFIRNTAISFNTDSFGHATSGAACASIVFQRAAFELGEMEYLPLAEQALDFCLKVQFSNPADQNLKGAILEKIQLPDGTDRSPYHIRDLGTIFFVQAAALYLKNDRSFNS